METAKPAQTYKFQHYDIELTLISERKLAISVIDNIQKAQFYQKELLLDQIGVNTLVKAFEKSKKEITAAITIKHVSENVLMEIHIAVESHFLKPVSETLFLKKIRDVSDAETVKKAIDYLSKRIKDIRLFNEKNAVNTYYGTKLESTYYNGAGYDSLASVKLPKGKYLLTFSFLAKPQSQWMYLYFNQGQTVMANCGFYMPATTNFMPHTIRKTHTVSGDSETVSFTTYCANSYPVTIKNAIIIAKPLSE